jgi:hypothetical protein
MRRMVRLPGKIGARVGHGVIDPVETDPVETDPVATVRVVIVRVATGRAPIDRAGRRAAFISSRGLPRKN